MAISENESNNIILNYPHNIKVDDLVHQCINNNIVQGIYWAYLKAQNEIMYNPVILDKLYEEPRDLLLISRTDLSPRIVVSSIVVDWQGHDTFWENIVRFVVEGRPSVGIVIKQGTITKEFNYLISSLRIKKIASTRYDIRSLDSFDPNWSKIHDVILFDPSWSKKDLELLQNTHTLVSSTGFSRAYYFENAGKNGTVLNILSNLKEFKLVSYNSLSWLISNYPEGNNPYWGGSFWTTVDVLKTLSEFNRPIKQYENRLMSEILKHDIDGSYDEVLGTTSSLLELYSMFGGKKSESYQRTLKWINSNIGSKTLYEQVNAIEVLIKLNENVDNQILQNLKSEVKGNLKSISNEFQLQRYIKVLISCNYIDDAEMLAMNLESLQNPIDGSWINIANTASTTLTLILLQKASRNPKHEIDEMIYKGILFLKSCYNPDVFSWNEDPLATALSLRTLKEFENDISFPVDEVSRSLENVDKEARNLIAIETSSNLNVKLQSRLLKLSEENEITITNLKQQLQSEKKKDSLAKWLSVTLSILVTILLIAIVPFIVYLSGEKLLYKASNLYFSFLTTKIVALGSSALVIIVFLLIWLLNRFDLLPSFLRKLFNFVLGSKIEKETKE